MILEPQQERQPPLEEPQAAIDRYWRLDLQTTDTGATSNSDSHCSHRSNDSQILEPGATDTEAMSNKNQH